MVTIEDFEKLDLRVAKIIEASDHPDADKLIVLKVDIGEEETRQIVAGIKKNYSKEELNGKSIVMICNLAPVKLRGVESQGMLLVASNNDELSLLTPDKEIPQGSKIS